MDAAPRQISTQSPERRILRLEQAIASCGTQTLAYLVMTPEARGELELLLPPSQSARAMFAESTKLGLSLVAGCVATAFWQDCVRARLMDMPAI